MSKFEDLNLTSYLDIGANTGQFHEEMQGIYPGIPAVMIEPNPFCVSKLNRILSRSSTGNCKVIQCGVSNKDGTLELMTLKSKTKSKGASFYQPIDYTDPDNILRIEVPVNQLDTLFPTESFDMVKIDVQGSERDAIEGGQNLLPRCKYVLIEVSLIEWNKGAASAEELVKMMQDLGFYIFRATDFHDYIQPIAQIDIVFSNLITEHNLEGLEQYRHVLGV
jgi:FkbM family methyltransferase